MAVVRVAAWRGPGAPAHTRGGACCVPAGGAVPHGPPRHRHRSPAAWCGGRGVRNGWHRRSLRAGFPCGWWPPRTDAGPCPGSRRAAPGPAAVRAQSPGRTPPGLRAARSPGVFARIDQSLGQVPEAAAGRMPQQQFTVFIEHDQPTRQHRLLHAPMLRRRADNGCLCVLWNCWCR